MNIFFPQLLHFLLVDAAVLLYRKSKYTLNIVFPTMFKVDACIFSFSPFGVHKLIKVRIHSFFPLFSKVICESLLEQSIL